MATSPEQVLELCQYGSWTITPEMGRTLLEHLRRVNPPRVLECGSGLSTVLIAAWAEEAGAEWQALEHAPAFYHKTRQLLHEHGLSAHGLIRAPLDDFELGDLEYSWYNFLPLGEYGFIFVDGPPGDVGRFGAGPALLPHLAPWGELWLDDADRPGEQEALRRWSADLDVRWAKHPDLPRVARVRP